MLFLLLVTEQNVLNDTAQDHWVLNQAKKCPNYRHQNFYIVAFRVNVAKANPSERLVAPVERN